MAALYDAKGNIVAKAGQALRRPKGLSVVNIGDGYRLCVQRATESVLAERLEWGTALLRRLLHGRPRRRSLLRRLLPGECDAEAA